MENGVIEITECPSCGSAKIKKLCCDWTGQYKGKKYTVPDLEFHECPECGEKLYDREAMRKIESCSPAFAKARARG